MTISHDSRDQRVCPVCDFTFEADESRDGRLCHMDEEWLHRNGHVAVIECDPERSGLRESEGWWMHVDNAYRTGRIDILPRAKAESLFRMRLPADKACLFVSRPTLNWLRVVSR